MGKPSPKRVRTRSGVLERAISTLWKDGCNSLQEMVVTLLRIVAVHQRMAVIVHEQVVVASTRR